MDKVTFRALSLVMVLGFLVCAPRTVRAQTALEATQIVVGAPAQSRPGEMLTVQAVLADSQGHPISKAVIYFTTQASFIGESGDVVVAQAVTNGNGQATATFVDNFSASIALNAEFRGDAQYAPSTATTQIETTGDGQAYEEHVGVDVPGLNVPPVTTSRASILPQQYSITGFVQNLWPAMNGWPVAALLLLVWSMYFLSVTFVVRLAKLGGENEDAEPSDMGRSK